MSFGMREVQEIEDPEREDEQSMELPDHFKDTYELKEDVEYEVNEYHYETDGNGRIARCEGRLDLEEGKRNPVHQRKAGGESRLESDDGGHLIACRFGGSEKIDNIVPMDAHLNRVGEYKQMENEWADALKDGNTVDVKIKCNYSGDSMRPDSFSVYYRVSDQDGNEIEHGKRRIMNEE